METALRQASAVDEGELVLEVGVDDDLTTETTLTLDGAILFRRRVTEVEKGVLEIVGELGARWSDDFDEPQYVTLRVDRNAGSITGSIGAESIDTTIAHAEARMITSNVAAEGSITAEVERMASAMSEEAMQLAEQAVADGASTRGIKIPRPGCRFCKISCAAGGGGCAAACVGLTGPAMAACLAGCGGGTAACQELCESRDFCD